ncbi:FAD-binding dehydrogenase, partial [Streptomyces sp. SID11233]|nr:FAD-binding dehydrogenase [Streptomyces sp. SID11233]
PVPLFPGFDTLGTLDHIMSTGHGYTWFVLNRRVIGKEFTLSGSEQNPDLTGKSVRGVIDRARADVPGPVKAFMDHGADFVVEKDLGALVRGMNALTDEPLIEEEALRRVLVERDREIANPFTKDLQVTAIRGARKFLGDR